MKKWTDNDLFFDDMNFEERQRVKDMPREVAREFFRMKPYGTIPGAWKGGKDEKVSCSNE